MSHRCTRAFTDHDTSPSQMSNTRSEVLSGRKEPCGGKVLSMANSMQVPSPGDLIPRQVTQSMAYCMLGKVTSWLFCKSKGVFKLQKAGKEGVITSISMSRSRENFEPHHAACTAPRRTPWLEVVLNPVVRPSTSFSTPNNCGEHHGHHLVGLTAPNLWSSGSVAQTTPYSARNDCHPQQPADPGQRVPEVQNVEVERQPKDLQRREGSLVARVELEAPKVVPTPRNGENILRIRIRVLTDHE